jgi:hypothetical protein
MTTQEVKRKLAAVLNADVKGYSRLMSEDEKGTVRTFCEREARAEAAELLRINPNFSVDQLVKRMPFKNQAENDRQADALYKAGLK